MTVRDCNGNDVPLSGYVHGVRVSADERRWNIALAGTLISADAAAAAEDWSTDQHMPVRNVPIEVLRQAHSIVGALESRGIALIQASMLRAGVNVGWGVPPYPFAPMTSEQQEAVLGQAEFELRLEGTRREKSPGAPSRLSCIWIADDDVEGRNYVHELVGIDAFLLPVQITFALRLARLDIRWLSGDVSGLADEQLLGYWSGAPSSDQPLWETPVDGAIRCTDDHELQRLRIHVRENIPFRPPHTGDSGE